MLSIIAFYMYTTLAISTKWTVNLDGHIIYFKAVGPTLFLVEQIYWYNQ